MRTKEFLNKLDHDRIVNAIQEAEAEKFGADPGVSATRETGGRSGSPSADDNSSG